MSSSSLKPPPNSRHNRVVAELADSVRERRIDLCAGINNIFLWKVSVLLVNENVPADFFSQCESLVGAYIIILM